MKRKWKSIAVLLLLLFFAICAIYRMIMESREGYISRKIERKELLGTWYFSESTRILLKKEGVQEKYLDRENNKLLLKNDSFECRIALPPKYYDGVMREHFLMKGQWTITYEENGKLVKNTLHLNTIEIIPSGTLLGLTLYIDEDNGELQLYKCLDDNFVRAYIFEKE